MALIRNQTHESVWCIKVVVHGDWSRVLFAAVYARKSVSLNTYFIENTPHSALLGWRVLALHNGCCFLELDFLHNQDSVTLVWILFPLHIQLRNLVLKSRHFSTMNAPILDSFSVFDKTLINLVDKLITALTFFWINGLLQFCFTVDAVFFSLCKIPAWTVWIAACFYLTLGLFENWLLNIDMW